MGNGSAVDFVGTPGPGAVINQYLPQPGQHVGRRILKVEDIATSFFLTSATALGIPWSVLLGVAKDQDGLWEVRSPELLASTWFSRQAQLAPAASSLGIKRAEASVIASARDVLAASGSLRSWSRRGARGSGAKMSLPDVQSGENPRPPGTSSGTGIPGTPGSSSSGADDHDANEQEATDAFASSLVLLEQGSVLVPSSTWGGGVGQTTVDLEAEPEPALFIIQVIGISSFLGDYGLGRTVKTFTLLPGETTTISTRTWRASEESIAQASSIIDSFDESAAERFADTVLSETTDTATRDKTENWYVDAEANASFGFAGASVAGGGGGEYSSSTEEFSKSVDESVREHTSESSSHRENSVTSSSEASTSTEDEEVIERTIKNINVRRVLNFTFRELNQEYITKTHLKEVRIAFSNGNSGSWREEPISGMRRLVEEVVKPEHVDVVCQDLLRTIAVVQDRDSTPIRVLEEVRLDACAVNAAFREATPGPDCEYPAPTADGRLYYRFKRGPVGQPPDVLNTVDGVLLKERTVVMATDSVVVEALLGQADALDEYSRDLQIEAIREKTLANDREALAQRIIGKHDTDGAALYAQVFFAPPEAAEVSTP